MISVTESSARSSSSGPRRIASLNTSSSSRTGSIPAGILPFDTTSSTIAWMLSRALSSSPSRSTPWTVSFFMSILFRSSCCIWVWTLRRTTRSGSSAASSRSAGSSSRGSASSCVCGAGFSSSAPSPSLSRIMQFPICTTIPESSDTGSSTGSPFTYVPFAL